LSRKLERQAEATYQQAIAIQCLDTPGDGLSRFWLERHH
jgi:hypothetical protein